MKRAPKNSENIMVKLYISKEQYGLIVDSSERAKEELTIDDKKIEEMFDMMQDGLFYELGIKIPVPKVFVDKDLRGNEFRIQLNDLQPLSMVGLNADQFLVNDTVDRLTLLDIKGEEAINPANGSECAVVQNKNGALGICENAGLTTWGTKGFIVLSLSAEIRKNAGAFLTTDIVKYDLNKLKEAFPDLVDSALQSFNIKTLAQILRELLDEEISIRDLRSILESLLAINGVTNVDLSKYIVFSSDVDHLCPIEKEKTGKDLDINDYSNFVRMSLKRYITHKYTRGGNTLVVYLLDHVIEERIMRIDKEPLNAEEKRGLIKSILNEVGNLPPTAQNPVILTTFGVRKRLRKLIKKEFPYLAVLSYQELSPDSNIQRIARISLSSD